MAAYVKTQCPVSREEFRQHAPANLPLTVNGIPVAFGAKEFSTNSFGWYANGKIVVEINGKMCQCQVGFNLTVVGSKELPK